MNKNIIYISVVLVVAAILSASSCNKGNDNPNMPIVRIDISIDPNSTIFYELNTVGGGMYLDGKPGVYIPPESRGIIVYRMDMNTFKAYERTPPNNPDGCCNTHTKQCTALIFDVNTYPFVVDTCTSTKYSILDGVIVDGTGTYPLIEYRCDYNGAILHIYN